MFLHNFICFHTYVSSLNWEWNFKIPQEWKNSIQILITMLCQSGTPHCSFVANFARWPLLVQTRETFKSSPFSNDKQVSNLWISLQLKVRRKIPATFLQCFLKISTGPASENLCLPQLENCPEIMIKCLPNCRVHLIPTVSIPKVSC